MASCNLYLDEALRVFCPYSVDTLELARSEFRVSQQTINPRIPQDESTINKALSKCCNSIG